MPLNLRRIKQTRGNSGLTTARVAFTASIPASNAPKAPGRAIVGLVFGRVMTHHKPTRTDSQRCFTDRSGNRFTSLTIDNIVRGKNGEHNQVWISRLTWSCLGLFTGS
jgi:hypothetical protein